MTWCKLLEWLLRTLLNIEEDELGFLKRHHDLEINMLKEQYERSLETAKLIAQETSKVNQQSISNHQV